MGCTCSGGRPRFSHAMSLSQKSSTLHLAPGSEARRTEDRVTGERGCFALLLTWPDRSPCPSPVPTPPPAPPVLSLLWGHGRSEGRLRPRPPWLGACVAPQCWPAGPSPSPGTWGYDYLDPTAELPGARRERTGVGHKMQVAELPSEGHGGPGLTGAQRPGHLLSAAETGLPELCPRRRGSRV